MQLPGFFKFLVLGGARHNQIISVVDGIESCSFRNISGHPSSILSQMQKSVKEMLLLVSYMQTALSSSDTNEAHWNYYQLDAKSTLGKIGINSM